MDLVIPTWRGGVSRRQALYYVPLVANLARGQPRSVPSHVRTCCGIPGRFSLEL